MKKPEGKLQELVTRLQQACGDDLASIVVYGSAAREDFHETFSDVNALILLRQLPAATFAPLSEALRWWSRDEKLTPPLVMTVEELRESADVFAIELLDIKRSHRTLFGEDIVATVDVPMNLHRVEVEHELRTTLLRLRHHFLLGSESEEELRAVLAKSVTSVVTLFRHALIAVGKEPSHDKAQTLQQAAESFGFDAAPISTVLALRQHDREPENLRDLYHAYMTVIQKVAHELERWAPKRNLQSRS
jgi:predicted nucleotidyltransferase